SFREWQTPTTVAATEARWTPARCRTMASAPCAARTCRGFTVTLFTFILSYFSGVSTLDIQAGDVIENGMWVREDGRNVFPLASSLTAFINSLRELTDT